MKKGCFLGTIIFLTIFIGIGFYLYKKYFTMIQNYGKEKLVEISNNKILEEINDLKVSLYKDSLKIYFDEQIKRLKTADFESTINEFGRISEQIKYSIEDGIIDSVEYTVLKNMAIKNERPKKN